MTQQLIAEAHGRLKRVGGEYKGPCPIRSCGGTDRFHVRREGYFYCRQCLPDSSNTERYKEILAALGLMDAKGG